MDRAATVTAPRFTGLLPPPRFNLARFALEAGARRHPEKPALIVARDAGAPERAVVWSYGALEDAVLRTAAALLDLELAKGDRLLIRLDHSAEYAILFLAAAAAGLVPIPVSSALTAAEVAFLIADAEPALIAADPVLAMPERLGTAKVIDATEAARLVHHPRRAGYADAAADDPAYLVYTSGTTSRPKGVLHAHRVIWGRRPMQSGWHGMTSEDRVLHAGQLNWTYTLGTGLLDPLAQRATAIVYAGPRDPAVWPHLIRNQWATLFAAVPSLYRQILKYAGRDVGGMATLRHGLTAGEALSEDIHTEWQARAATPLYEAFGMSELSTYISSGPGVPVRPRMLGKPQPGRAVTILPVDGGTEPLPAGETGLIACHRTDPGLMLGYWRRPEEEREVFRGDWFIGGDLGSQDADGYIAFHGRANDLMNAFGYRVSPLEVEAVLERHPAVAEVAVAEVDAGEGRTIIAAFVVARDGAHTTESELMGHAAEMLAAYKCPRRIVFAEQLPRTATGKLQRNALPGVSCG